MSPQSLLIYNHSFAFSFLFFFVFQNSKSLSKPGQLFCKVSYNLDLFAFLWLVSGLSIFHKNTSQP